MIGTIIGLLSGALGGNVAGKLMPNSSMGTLWNSVAGIAGGGIGSTILGMLGIGAASATDAAASGGMPDIGTLLGMGGSGLVGGGAVMAILGFIRKAMNKG